MCFNKCFKHLDSFLFIFKHKILEMFWTFNNPLVRSHSLFYKSKKIPDRLCNICTDATQNWEMWHFFASNENFCDLGN